MNLIYMCVFHQQSYINLLKLLITSLHIKSNIINKNIDILIITSPAFEPLIQQELQSFKLPLHYYILDLHSLFDAGCARLNIFNYNPINVYDKILYLDTDILINSDISILFNLELSSEKIYAVEEGTIGHEHWGSMFFDFTKFNTNQAAFTSGILFFRNTDSIKFLFESIQTHIQDYIYIKNNSIPPCLDQPFIVYNSIVQNKYDNQLLKTYVENNPHCVQPEKIIYHFPGGPGAYSSKISKMTYFWKKMHTVNTLNICQHGTDGFGHQIEGMLRLISLSLNHNARYMYNFKKHFTFEHLNFNIDLLNSYLLNALDLVNDTTKKTIIDKEYNVKYNERRDFNTILQDDNDYANTIYCYDGVGDGGSLPHNFEEIGEFRKSIPALREAFVLQNKFLPKPSYHNKKNNIVCHIRLGDAVNQRVLDTKSIFECIKQFQKNSNNTITIHSNGNIDILKSDNTIIYDKHVDVLQVFSDFIHADTLIINYSSLSIAAHLLADSNQIVICPNIAGPTFFKRILPKCIKISEYNTTNYNNKTYLWENSPIRFYSNCYIDEFGGGNYTRINDKIIQANFGGRQHTIVFNDGYTEFTSTRKDDNYIVKGRLM